MKTFYLRKQSGSSLVVVLSVLATLMVIVGVAVEYTTTVNRHVKRSNTVASAVAVGDNCMDILFSNWRTICRANPTTAITTAAFASIALPTATQLNLPSVSRFAKRGTGYNPNVDELDTTYTISNYNLVATDAEWKALGSASTAPKPMLGQIAAAITSGTPAPTTPAVFNYIASADVTLPALGKDGYVIAKVRRVFQKQQLSPWNFAIFYVDPLEIHPGPQFTVTGWVHTNSDLYTAHNTLTFADKVTYGSDWFVNFKPGDLQHPNQTPQSPNYPSNLPPARDDAKQPFGMDSTSIFNPTDGNPNNDSYHELIEQAVAGNPDPLAGQRYYDQAAIRILIDGSNNLTIKKLNGTTVTSSSSGNDLKLYNAITSAVTTNQPIQDNREAASVRLATLDVGSIVTSLSNPSSSTNYIDSSRWNGIIYMSDTSYSSSLRRGVRIKNAKTLPSSAASSQINVNGITIASANPVYIQGDYNTGTGTVPSNSIINNDPTTPQSAGYTRQPSSIVADAVTILSNSWLDSAAGTVPVASYTTVNTAVIAGIVATAPVGGDGSYSGGAENFPRFLENWATQKLTYYGSMIELYQSGQSNGEWGKANVYSPPVRQWYFDTYFKTTPPPGSLMIYSYIKGKWSVL